ncbi:hypothetical protein CT151_23620 [Raoultella planticola]|nr:hypothetical protein CT151_23620 [Raoultella planticola]
MNFQNKVAVITGSTAGIGQAVAEQLHKYGAKVVIVSRSSEQAKQQAKRLTSQGQQALGLGCDVSQPGNDSNLLIVFYVQIMPDDFVMQLHRF